MTENLPLLVLGAGSWGTALALVLAHNGHTVRLWSHNPEHVQQLQAARQNAHFLPDIIFPNNLHPISELTPHVSDVKHIIVAVPSHGFRETLTKLQPLLNSYVSICWATKGLENNTGLLLHQVAQAVLGDNIPLSVLSGPSFAKEVAAQLPTAITIAANEIQHAQVFADIFHNPHYFRAYTNTDIIGVQVGGAIKNVIAIAAGIADGLAFGANTRAALITRGLTEMVRFGMALGGKQETFMGLTGLGDLMLTCTDDLSRNRRFGYKLAKGLTLQQAQTEIGQVVEGVLTAHEVNRLAQKLDIDMPIVAHVHKVLNNECSPQQAVKLLLAREPKQENL